MSFGGNPNVTITAINTAGGIVCSRTSGTTPCFVHVSASAITATGTTKPYEDLEYAWDFGDPSGTESFTQPLDSTLLIYNPNAVNANTAQTGPEAAYVYRSAGTYTVTLTIRGQNGGAFTTATVTQSITVSSFVASGGEYYFAATSGNDANDGLTSGTPKKSMSALSALLASNTKFHLKRGENWSGTSGLGQLSVSNVRFDAYGSGANPKIELTSGTGNPILVKNNSGASPDNIVFSNIDFASSGTNAPGSSCVVSVGAIYDAGNTHTVTNVYFDNCNISSAVTSAAPLSLGQYSFAAGVSGIGMWGGSVTNSVAAGYNGVGDVGYQWGFVFGTSISGSSTDIIHDHHIYPETRYHALYRYIPFGSGSNRGFCINVNYERQGASLEYAEFQLISDCDCTGVSLFHDGSNGTDDASLTRFRNFVSQRNAVHGLSGGALVIAATTESLTERDNLFWGDNGGVIFNCRGSAAAFLAWQFYRNYFYLTSGATPPDVGIFSFGAGSYPSFTQKQFITDNKVFDARTSPDAVEAVIAGLTGSGSVIDRNTWWNASTSSMFYSATLNVDAASAQNFTTWQGHGFDANGSFADPGFADPVNGNFSALVSHRSAHGKSLKGGF